ncbi:hypothetical protein LJR225_003569 [Phenylobacterium sp. LjRoot225]|uniref:hypothetical protein n=1 Tax=Phenylobacterium sp. LjRoot225 TaxID=3342285 RepID=UPI003ED04269
MIALLLAAGLAASDAPLIRSQAACNAGMLHTSVDPALLLRPQDWNTARPRKLGDLPRAKAEYAVVRLVEGCMVAAPARYTFRPK